MAEFFAAPGDIELAAINYLKTHFPAATVTVRRPWGTDWREPSDELIIRVEVIGGEAPRSEVLDPWTLSIEVWQTDADAAPVTAGHVCGWLNVWSGRHSGVLIYECRATRPRSAPDPLTSTPRYLITAAGIARLLGV